MSLIVIKKDKLRDNELIRHEDKEAILYPKETQKICDVLKTAHRLFYHVIEMALPSFKGRNWRQRI